AVPCPLATQAPHSFPTRRSSVLVEQLHPPAVAIVPLGIRKIAHFGLSVKTRMAGIEHALLEGKAIAQGVLNAGHSRLDAQAEMRSEEHTSELQSRFELVCCFLLE